MYAYGRCDYVFNADPNINQTFFPEESEEKKYIHVNEI